MLEFVERLKDGIKGYFWEEEYGPVVTGYITGISISDTDEMVYCVDSTIWYENFSEEKPDIQTVDCVYNFSKWIDQNPNAVLHNGETGLLSFAKDIEKDAFFEVYTVRIKYNPNTGKGDFLPITDMRLR